MSLLTHWMQASRSLPLFAGCFGADFFGGGRGGDGGVTATCCRTQAIRSRFHSQPWAHPHLGLSSRSQANTLFGYFAAQLALPSISRSSFVRQAVCALLKNIPAAQAHCGLPSWVPAKLLFGMFLQAAASSSGSGTLTQPQSGDAGQLP